MPTAPDVRKLAAHRGRPVVTSVYLDVDGRSRPVADDYRAAFERLADGLRRRAGSDGDQLVRRSVAADIDRMRDWLRSDLDRSTTRGVALFACSGEDWFAAVDLSRPVHDAAGLGPAPRVSQLLAAVDGHERVLVALVDRRRLRLLQVESGDVDEVAGLEDREERAVDTSVELGGYQRHADDLARGHYRRAAELIGRAAAGWPAGSIVVAGPDASVAALEDALPAEVRAKVVGRAGLSTATPAHDVLPAVGDIVEAAERRRQSDLVEHLRQQAARSAHLGVVGLETTLAALADRRVESLVVSEGFVAPGAHCPACGWTGVDVRQCPACATTTSEIDDLVEHAVGDALAQGAAVEVVRDTELDRFGRIGALTRH